MNTDKLCQSCGMPLQDKQNNLRGTEQDGSLSAEFCFHCYKDGKYTNPNITYDQMLEICQNAISESKMNFFTKFLSKKSYPTLLKQLKRWK